jgi:hypothetical protein
MNGLPPQPEDEDDGQIDWSKMWGGITVSEQLPVERKPKPLRSFFTKKRRYNRDGTFEEFE